MNEQSGPYFADVTAFVENYLSPVYRRPVGAGEAAVWCPQWWRHAEAAVRLDSVWRAWEYFRSGGPGLDGWFLGHADRHLRVLTDPRGPFGRCGGTDGHSDATGPLPVAPVPTGMFADEFDAGSRAGTVYPDVGEFVRDYLSRVYQRDVTESGDAAWCPQWWRHADVVARLDALWRAWEYLRRFPATGLSDWFLDHADPHMRRIIDRDGPFRHCGAGHREGPAPLPLVPPDAGLFAEVGGVTKASRAGAPHFTDVAGFVAGYLAQVYRRPADANAVWCPQWWRHAEAVIRLDGLWREWERSRYDDTVGSSLWFLRHADAHVDALTRPGGPFAHCGGDTGHRDTLGPLPVETQAGDLFRREGVGL